MEKTGQVESISIHAPVKGATCYETTLPLRKNHFNPRTREGCDSDGDRHELGQHPISIHAPVKGATYPFKLDREGLARFQSTHP